MKRASHLVALIFAVCCGIAVAPHIREQSVFAAARCQVTVPSEWGEFLGGSNYGLAFRDKQGTIRFVTQLPCGLEGPVSVALEVKRK